MNITEAVESLFCTNSLGVRNISATFFFGGGAVKNLALSILVLYLNSVKVNVITSDFTNT